MIIINPNTVSPTLSIIPRYYNIDNDQTIEFTNEDTNVSWNLSYFIKRLSDGYIEYLFTNPSTLQIENLTFSVKITDDTTGNIIWRGKVFTTSQVSQKYKINGV